jgi:alginate O-acetyltransferase complex protein AlgI
MMLAISLWHGLTMNYLVWGIYHAAGLLVYRAWSDSATAVALRERLPAFVRSFLGWLITFQFVMLGFVFTKEASLTESFHVLGILRAGVFGGV